MKSREEQLTWAKQRALICVNMGRFSDAVAGLRADLDENPLTKGVVSSDQARRGYKAAADAALGRGYSRRQTFGVTCPRRRQEGLRSCAGTSGKRKPNVLAAGEFRIGRGRPPGPYVELLRLALLTRACRGIIPLVSGAQRRLGSSRRVGRPSSAPRQLARAGCTK